VWSFRRYLKMLVAAQTAASHSVCNECQAYGRLEVLRVGAEPPEPEAEPWVKVRCRACGHEWLMD